MSRRLQIGLGIVIVLLLIGGPVVLAFHLDGEMRNFRVVHESVLYRSGQMTRAGLARILHDYGIKTVICLRDGTTASDRAEEKFCKTEEVQFVRIPPCHWGETCGSAPVEAEVRKFRAIMADPRNYPVLVHCLAGIHRTGAYCAIYRMEFEHWSNERALAEMKACGYTNLDEELDVLGYLEQYRPSWKPQEQAPPPPPPPAQPRPRRVHKRHSTRPKEMGRGGTLPACRQQAAGGFPRIRRELFWIFRSAESAFIRVPFFAFPTHSSPV